MRFIYIVETPMQQKRMHITSTNVRIDASENVSWGRIRYDRCGGRALSDGGLNNNADMTDAAGPNLESTTKEWAVRSAESRAKMATNRIYQARF